MTVLHDLFVPTGNKSISGPLPVSSTAFKQQIVTLVACSAYYLQSEEAFFFYTGQIGDHRAEPSTCSSFYRTVKGAVKGEGEDGWINECNKDMTSQDPSYCKDNFQQENQTWTDKHKASFPSLPPLSL